MEDSEPFSVIRRSSLRALCQHFFDELLHTRKHPSDVSREPAFLGQGVKRDLVEPSSPANRVFLFSQRSDANLP